MQIRNIRRPFFVDGIAVKKRSAILPVTSGTSITEHASEVEREISRDVDVSIIHLVDCLINRAHVARASDVHFDPRATGIMVRLRIDGVMHDAHFLPLSMQHEVVSRIKVLANLRTDEHQATQDGRFRHFFKKGEYIDIRVSIAPTYHGENVVLRLLSKAEQFSLETLGFSESDRKKIVAAIERPHGMILATGPTGSGKTTTLYTLIKMLNSPEVSIVTIEDPIEYAVDNIEQIQVNPRAGLTFANGLRSILRQDPNIIMVGEIRDAETAGIAVNTALTGHLLLSTLHTNDATTTLPRLLDMGVDSYLVSSIINIAIAQRLVRRICRSCREEIAVNPAMYESLSHVKLNIPIVLGEVFFRGAGCTSCNQSGYAGRVCVNEVLVADADIREKILLKASAAELRAVAIQNGMTPMLEDGLCKVRSGETTIAEILRVIHE